ncbi:DUF721 domain-containing protein [Mycetocola tolaasinivorans]|uniref:DUF721 domain-containing protein n=1 Tax=Mycetocola tolaasinivorans TaxID=76635 RepID=A0A3L7A792_9MICO|nr:DciA family protein [Mycetocola tolaasinivorans]RLP75222.1 DUF721 domain-containing protein [Mycetocola tolaasinivorans]
MPSPKDKRPAEAMAVYEHFKFVFTGTRHRTRKKRQDPRDSGESMPYGRGREPRGLGDVMSALTVQLGWDSNLSRAELMDNWIALAGEETAKHSTPIAVENGTLSVQCESTAWATQLRLMRLEIMKQIALRYPDAGIEGIRFVGPNVPSFKRGPRSVQGRGVRDTYG